VVTDTLLPVDLSRSLIELTRLLNESESQRERHEMKKSVGTPLFNGTARMLAILGCRHDSTAFRGP